MTDMCATTKHRLLPEHPDLDCDHDIVPPLHHRLCHPHRNRHRHDWVQDDHRVALANCHPYCSLGERANQDEENEKRESLHASARLGSSVKKFYIFGFSLL